MKTAFFLVTALMALSWLAWRWRLQPVRKYGIIDAIVPAYNEELCIITSLNLYEFSQVNNNEMGVLISRDDDAELFQNVADEAQRIIRISDKHDLCFRCDAGEDRIDVSA